MKCEYCNSDHDGSFGSGRFCSKKCSRGFSTKNKRKDINIKVSKKLTGRIVKEDTKIALKEAWKRIKETHPKLSKYFKRNGTGSGRLRTQINLICVLNSEFSNRYIRDRLLEEGIKKNICEICGIDSWLEKPLTMQFHHVNGNNKDNRLENLQMLCPNCHTQTGNWAGRNRSKRSVAQLERAHGYEPEG